MLVGQPMKHMTFVFLLKLDPSLPPPARDYTCTVYGTIGQILKVLGYVFITGQEIASTAYMNELTVGSNFVLLFAALLLALS